MNREQAAEDKMSREELVDFIKCTNGHWTFVTESGKKISKEQVIEALEQKPICDDCISRQEMLKYFEGWKNKIKYYHPYAKNFDIPYEEAIQWVKDMPPVNPQKPICPSAGIDCEDCPAYEDAISRQAVIDATVKTNSIWNSITNSKGENLEEIISQLPSVSSSEKPNKCEDAISRQAVLDEISDYNNDFDYTTNELYDRIKRMSSVNPQPCEDAISRKSVLDLLENTNNGWIIDKVLQLPPVNPQEPKSEWEHDHEILKAYSDGANAVLDKIRAEIESLKPCQGCFYDGITRCLEIIDKYVEEDKA